MSTSASVPEYEHFDDDDDDDDDDEDDDEDDEDDGDSICFPISLRIMLSVAVLHRNCWLPQPRHCKCPGQRRVETAMRTSSTRWRWTTPPTLTVLADVPDRTSIIFH